MAEASSAPSPSRKEFPLRLEAGSAAKIARLAACEIRSANAQIEVLLRSRLSRAKAPATAQAPERGSPRKAIALRLPAALLDQLAQGADALGRSTNAHIELLLLEELQARGC